MGPMVLASVYTSPARRWSRMAGASGSKASSTKAAPSGGLSLGVVYRLQAGAESLYPAYEVLCGLLDSSSRYRTVAWPRKMRILMFVCYNESEYLPFGFLDELKMDKWAVHFPTTAAQGSGLRADRGRPRLQGSGDRECSAGVRSRTGARSTEPHPVAAGVNGASPRLEARLRVA